MPSGPVAGVPVIENVSCTSGPSAGLLVEGPRPRGRRSHPIALRARDVRLLAAHASSPEDVLVPRGAVAFADDTDSCSREVPVLGG